MICWPSLKASTSGGQAKKMVADAIAGDGVVVQGGEAMIVLTDPDQLSMG